MPIQPHLHHKEDEYSVVIAGVVTFQLGEQIIQGTPGTLLAKPRGVWHVAWNAGNERARVQEIISPGGVEKFFDELAELFSGGRIPNREPRLVLAQKYSLEFDRTRIPDLVQKYKLKFPGVPDESGE